MEALDLLHQHGTAGKASHFATHPDGKRGMSRAGFQARLNAAREAINLGRIEWTAPERPVEPPPDYDAGRTDKPQVVIRPTYRVAAAAADGRGKTRVISIGDCHDSPDLPDKSRFRWMGAYIREVKPDCVTQIGDLVTLDSLTRHIPNDSLSGKVKPSFQQDMDSAGDALSAFDEGLNGYDVERHCTLGNHERRALAFEEMTPEIAGMVESNIFTLLGDHDWTYSPFGAFHFIGGVGFVHVPKNRMDRAYGGMYAYNQIARDSLFDVVYGHSHIPGVHRYPKLNHQAMTVVNLGCSLPDGHVEPYAKHALTGWGYGIFDITIERGRIQKAHHIPMEELQERYG